MAIRFSHRRGFVSDLKDNVEYIRKLFAGNKRQVAFLLLLIILGIGVGSATPYLFGLLIDSIVAGNARNIKKCIVLFLGLNVFSVLVGLIESFLGNNISLNASYRIKQSILGKILCLKVKEQDKCTTGEWMNRLEGDADNIIEYYVDLLSSFVMIIFNELISVFFLIKISPLLTLVAIIFFPLGYIINFFFGDKVKVLKKELKNTEDENLSLINCILSNLRNIKVWQIESKFIDKYEWLKKKRIKAQKNSYNLSLVISFLQKTNNIVFEVVVLIVSSILIFSGNLSVGGMVSFNSYLEKFFNAISKSLELNMSKNSIRVSIERINEINSKECEKFSDTKGIIDVKKIAFENVSFGYNSKRIFSNINFCIDKPGIYTFVGKNGVGKTTLLRLVDKLYDVECGNIRINDKDIQDLSTDIVRNSITFMMKDTIIIPGSLWDNLTIGVKKNINEKEIDYICELIQLTSLVRKIGGYHCKVSENVLSSGEKQKIGLARVLLRKYSVVMLDEVTSDLDGSIEEKIISLLKEMASNRIILNVCHRKKFVEASTQIFVIEEKKGIVESGTHSELMERRGCYCELF